MLRPSTIAIDGPVAVGKNAVGSLLAQRLGYRFIDTGAMYRALTLAALERRIDLEDEKALGKLAAETRIDLVQGEDGYLVFVDGQEVTQDLRQEGVEKGVSPVAKVGPVREALVAEQQRMAQGGGIVMAGRDIGTVVLPQADLKIYLAASAEERAQRRHRELLQRGENPDYTAILADLRRRDGIDSERSHSPLKPAPDAWILDTEGLSLEEVLAKILVLIEGSK